MTLTQQLEDKKKEQIEVEENIKLLETFECSKDSNCHEYYDLREEKQYLTHCQAEITILEQAIAEMQKQRQYFIEMMNNEVKFWKSEEKPDKKRKLQVAFMIEIIDNFKEQLNQPKTEKENSKHD